MSSKKLPERAILYHDESQRQAGAFRNTDPRSYLDLERRRLFPLPHHQRTARHIATVLRPSDAHSERQFPGAGRQILLPARVRPPPEHGGDTADWVNRANQYAAWLALRLRHQVQAFVHAVDEVDI